MYKVEQKIYLLFYHDRTMMTNHWETVRKNLTLEKARTIVKRKRKDHRYVVKDFGGRMEVTLYRYRITMMVFLMVFSFGCLIGQSRLLTGMTAFLSGAADGVNQALLFHYDEVQRVHPNIKDQWWDPDISWKNKYKDWDEGDTRARFPLSKTAFVSLTDGYHLTRMLSNKLLGTAITYNFSGPHRDKWYMYVVETLAIFAVRSLGFHLTYTLVYGRN